MVLTTIVTIVGDGLECVHHFGKNMSKWAPFKNSRKDRDKGKDKVVKMNHHHDGGYAGGGTSGGWQGGQGSMGFVGSSYSSKHYSHHRHEPRLVIQGTGNPPFEVYGASQENALKHLAPFANEGGLIVTLLGKPYFMKSLEDTNIPPHLEDRLLPFFSSGWQEHILALNWPDYGIIDFPLEFWREMARIVQGHKKTLVYCVGGHGRTGTFLACLLRAFGYDGEEAIKLVKERYCQDAIEAVKQTEYIKRMDVK